MQTNLSLVPESFLGRWYRLYETLGGDPHTPEIDTVWRFARKLILWTPWRWILYAHLRYPRIAFPLWLGIVVWSVLHPYYGANFCLGLIFLLLLGDGRDALQTLTAAYQKAHPANPKRLTVRLKP